MPLAVIASKIPAETAAALRERAAEEGVTSSMLVRRLVATYLDDDDQGAREA